MGINYTLFNTNAPTATAVLVKNALDGVPIKPAPGGVGNPGAATAPPAPATFAYFPWQFLDPSVGASESFVYEDTLSVVVQKVVAANTVVSKQTKVMLGNSYLLIVIGEDIRLKPMSRTAANQVEIAVPASADPYLVNIEWYLGGHDIDTGQCAGVTSGMAPGTSALYQPDGGTLLFLPAPPGAGAQTCTPADANEAATAYRPPIVATLVKATLDTAATPRYQFDQPNALPAD